MLLDGARNATGLYWGVSQTEASLWSHLGAIGRYRSPYASLCFLDTWSTCLNWVWFVGVANTNLGFIVIVVGVLHQETLLEVQTCCRCNGSGRCRGYVCAKNKRACTSCTPGRCENQPDAVSDSTQDSNANYFARNNERRNTHQVNEDIRETQSVMAEDGPDDHYQN